MLVKRLAKTTLKAVLCYYFKAFCMN